MRSTYNATQFLRIFAGKEATKEQLDMLLGNRHFDLSERPHSDNMPGRGVRANEDDDDDDGDEYSMNPRSTETSESTIRVNFYFNVFFLSFYNYKLNALRLEQVLLFNLHLS